MRRAENAVHWKKILTIRTLEKAKASQELIKAKQDEEDRDFAKGRAEKAMSVSYQNWESNLEDGTMLPEHLIYYANELNEKVVSFKQAEEDHKLAVKFTSAKDASLMRSDALLKNTRDISRKLNRRVARDKDERVMRDFEDRFSHQWSCKS